jgi:hypothetical protein
MVWRIAPERVFLIFGEIVLPNGNVTLVSHFDFPRKVCPPNGGLNQVRDRMNNLISRPISAIGVRS